MINKIKKKRAKGSHKIHDFPDKLNALLILSTHLHLNSLPSHFPVNTAEYLKQNHLHDWI